MVLNIRDTISAVDGEDNAAESGEELQESAEETDLQLPPVTNYQQREIRSRRMLEVGAENLQVCMPPVCNRKVMLRLGIVRN